MRLLSLFPPGILLSNLPKPDLSNQSSILEGSILAKSPSLRLIAPGKPSILRLKSASLFLVLPLRIRLRIPCLTVSPSIIFTMAVGPPIISPIPMAISMPSFISNSIPSPPDLIMLFPAFLMYLRLKPPFTSFWKSV